MATRLPALSVSENDPFSETEDLINVKYNKLIEALNRRREQMLTELRALREQHKEANVDIVHEIQDLETSKAELTQFCKEMKANVGKLETEKSILKLEQQISDLKKKISAAAVDVEFSCDTHELEQIICNLGKICVKSGKRDDQVIQRDYSLIKSPLFKSTEFASNVKHRGVCIDNSTDLVYITDLGNMRIQVLTLNGKYVSKFGEGVLENPVNIAISNRAVFVSDLAHNSVFKFDLSNHSLLARSTCKLQFLRGICFDKNELFVTSNYNSIVVLDSDLRVSRRYTRYINRCFDIKIKNLILYVLEVDTIQIKLLDSNTGDLIDTIVTNKDGADFANACYFCLDQSDNFLITNWATNQIKIITKDGTPLRLIDTLKWKLKEPRGIEVSETNKIIVVGAGMFCQI